MLQLIVCVVLLSVVSAELPQLDGRIVGGQDVPITAHPHQVSVRYRSCTACAYSHDCGGSIADESNIITAAHCVYLRNATNFAVVAGSENRDGGDGVFVLVDGAIVHENYDSASRDFDIAVLKLTIPLPIDFYTIRPIELATEQSSSGEVATVTGWGHTSQGGVPSSKLQAVNVPVISNEQCSAAYGEGLITENMMCAGYTDGGRDACQGDSGGPLVVGGKLAGVVSWGFGCADPNYPGVYANVPTLRTWLESAISGPLPTTTTPTDTTPTDSTPTGSTPTPTESTPTSTQSTSTPTDSTPTPTQSTSTPTGSTPTDSTPTGSTPTDSTPTGSTPTPTDSTSTPTGSTPTPTPTASPTPPAEFKFDFY